MKLTRTAALILALAMVFALAGCGADKAEPIDTAALAGQLVEAASFGEPMNALDSAVALGLYGAGEGRHGHRLCRHRRHRRGGCRLRLRQRRSRRGAQGLPRAAQRGTHLPVRGLRPRGSAQARERPHNLRRAVRSPARSPGPERRRENSRRRPGEAVKAKAPYTGALFILSAE